jgi:hypothetical protein
MTHEQDLRAVPDNFHRGMEVAEIVQYGLTSRIVLPPK